MDGPVNSLLNTPVFCCDPLESSPPSLYDSALPVGLDLSLSVEHTPSPLSFVDLVDSEGLIVAVADICSQAKARKFFRLGPRNSDDVMNDCIKLHGLMYKLLALEEAGRAQVVRSAVLFVM